eukprot:2845689-Rhodomonas_salina.1
MRRALLHSKLILRAELQIRSIWIPTAFAFRSAFALGSILAVLFFLLPEHHITGHVQKEEDATFDTFSAFAAGVFLCWAAGLCMLVAIRDLEDAWADFSSDVTSPHAQSQFKELRKHLNHPAPTSVIMRA